MASVGERGFYIFQGNGKEEGKGVTFLRECWRRRIELRRELFEVFGLAFLLQTTKIKKRTTEMRLSGFVN